MTAWCLRTDILFGSRISLSQSRPVAKITHSESTAKQRKIFLPNWPRLDIRAKEFLATIVGSIVTAQDDSDTQVSIADNQLF
jgi:hypothetical protein